MAAYVPGDDTNTMFAVSKSTDISIASTYMISGRNYHIFVTATTTVVEIRGLTRAQALAYGSSADYNYDNRHGVLFKTAATLYAWMRCDRCEGNQCRAEPRRINEADMWRVTITLTSSVASHSDWSSQYKETY